MQEINIIALLQKYSAEIVISAVTACIITVIIYKFSKLSKKTFFITSFLLGLGLYLIFGFIILKSSITSTFANALTSGGLATVLCIFTKRFTKAFGSDLKKQLEKLLSSLCLGEQLDCIIEEIVLKLKDSGVLDFDSLKALLKDGIDDSISEEDLNKLCIFLIETFSDNSKGKNKNN